VASEKILAKPRSGRSKRKGGLGEEIFARRRFWVVKRGQDMDIMIGIQMKVG